VELVWDDGVAPETAIDFDALNVSSGEALGAWLLGLGFFAVLYGIIAWSDPASRSPVVSRAAVLDLHALKVDMGLINEGEEDEEEGHDHEEEEED
jgi:hypothetical protein